MLPKVYTIDHLICFDKVDYDVNHQKKIYIYIYVYGRYLLQMEKESLKRIDLFLPIICIDSLAIKEDTAIGHALFLLIACDIRQKQQRDNVNICLYVCE